MRKPFQRFSANFRKIYLELTNFYESSDEIFPVLWIIVLVLSKKGEIVKMGRMWLNYKKPSFIIQLILLFR